MMIATRDGDAMRDRPSTAAGYDNAIARKRWSDGTGATTHPTTTAIDHDSNAGGRPCLRTGAVRADAIETIRHRGRRALMSRVDMQVQGRATAPSARSSMTAMAMEHRLHQGDVDYLVETDSVV